MKTVERLFRAIILFLIFVLFDPSLAYAQFCDSSSGLLQMPTAEMQDDGTVMITNNFLNRHALSPRGWGYDTFQYGLYVSLWERVEIGYVCTIFNDHWKNRQSREGVWMINQDRHFTGRVLLFREGDFGTSWVPAVAIGASDPITGEGDGEYSTLDNVSGSGNGYFNRYFIVMTKHFQTSWGRVGTHAGYQFNRRKDYPINGLCVGVDWSLVWLKNKGVLDGLDVVLEYDSRTVNCGFIASIWDNHFEAMFELQNFQWVNFGLRYKFRLRY